MRFFTLILLVALGSTCLNAEVIYVKQGGTGNGSSWKKAFGDLISALDVADFGDQIWVAAGTYKPTQKTDRSATFELTDGVELYGGFLGTEKTLEDRNWATNTTILSGEIGSEDKKDNSYTIVYVSNVSENTRLDGFTITRAAANGLGDKGDLERCGGGLFNDGAGGESNPTIANCTFIHNYGRDGAAIYNYAKEGVCNPLVDNCQFIKNKADLDGGAIYNDSQSGICNPTFKDCRIMSNEATYGGGILNYAQDGGEANPSIIGCSFESNIAYVRGGGMYCNEQGGKCKPAVTSSYFADNRSTVGKDIYKQKMEQEAEGVVVSKGKVSKL